MHTYRKHKGSWNVFFNYGPGDDELLELRDFDKEIEAVAFAHFLNGGELPLDVLQQLLKDK